MPVLIGSQLFLAEGYCASRAITSALKKIPNAIEFGSQHETWPSLAAKGFFMGDITTYSVVRHPLDIIATQCGKGSFFPPHCWLRRRYRHRDPFFCHRCDVTLRYERGLQWQIEEILQQRIDLEIIAPTVKKKPWEAIFDDYDYKFALATIPELFTLGYVPWHEKTTIKPEYITDYIERYGDLKLHR